MTAVVDPLTAPFAAVAALLAAAGAAKLWRPTRTAGALAAAGWRVPAAAVRAGAGAELVVGLTAIVTGGATLAAAVAASYLGFAVFLARALTRGTPIGSCGCFGEADTPPSPVHVVVDLAAAALAAAVAGRGGVDDLASVLAHHTGTGVALALLSGVVAYLAYAVLVVLPLATPRRAR